MKKWKDKIPMVQGHGTDKWNEGYPGLADAFDSEELKKQEDAFTKPGALLSALQETNTTGGLKFDQGKARFGLIPPSALWEVARVMTYGATKYPAKNNWLKGMEWHRPFDAIFRHIYNWQMGERFDKESDCHHLAHAIVNLMFLYVYERFDLGDNDIQVASTGEPAP